MRLFFFQPAQAAAMRAELHRRSIAQMRVSWHSLKGFIMLFTLCGFFLTFFNCKQINNCSLQDLQIFGDPSRIPIIIVERVVNAPMLSPSGNTYFRNTDPKDSNGTITRIDPNFSSTKQKSRILKIAVFVHGFQAC